MDTKSPEFDEELEYYKCSISPIYFINNYVKIFSADSARWIPFTLWPSQAMAIDLATKNVRLIVPKTRQGGVTWTFRGYYLWKAIFQPVRNIGFFSKSDPDAIKLLSSEKGFKGMYERLPGFLKPEGNIGRSNDHLFVLPNDSMIECRPYTQGESDTYTDVLCDEADRFPPNKFAELVGALEPALEVADNIVYVSIVDKSRSSDIFQNTCRAALKGESLFKIYFIPWNCRPDRDKEWYQKTYNEALVREDDPQKAKDWMDQQYPSTIEDALRGASSSKRFPYSHVERVFVDGPALELSDAPDMPGLRWHVEPRPDRSYTIGADPAEGVGADPSVAQVLDTMTGEHIATLAGQFEPKADFPVKLFQLARYLNDASILVERNNHGHAVIGTLDELIYSAPNCSIEQLCYTDDQPGWLSSPRGKALAHNMAASMIKNREVSIRDRKTKVQLQDIDIKTLSEVAEDHNDHALAFVLACQAMLLAPTFMSGKIFV